MVQLSVLLYNSNRDITVQSNIIVQNMPVIFGPETQELFDWCFTQAFNWRKDYIAILEEHINSSSDPALRCRKS